MTAPNPPSSIDENDLHAWVDGRMPADKRDDFARRVAMDPVASALAQAWEEQRNELRGLFADVKAEPAPASMHTAAQAAAATHALARRTIHGTALAASVFVAFAAGWVGNNAWQSGIGHARGAEMAQARFAQQAMVAHVVYAPEVKHPVEVTAAQQEHLVQWLSKRLGKPLKVPALQAQGYELVGGRLLPGEDGARAQFMFQDTAGKRVTLYIGAMAAAKAGADETGFRFVSEDGATGFYWVDQGTGYALAGQMPKPALLELATVVHQQLGMR